MADGSCSLDFMKQGVAFDLMPGSMMKGRCSVCCERHFGDCGELSKQDANIDDDLHRVQHITYKRNCSLLSKSSRMSQNFVYVYQRRKVNKKSPSFFEIFSSATAKASNGGHSAFSSEAPLLDAKDCAVSVPERATEGVRSPVLHPVENSKVATASSNEFRAVEEAGSEEALTSDVDRILNDCNAKDHCSSSKSSLELSSPVLKVHTDDAGECSSSGTVITGKEPEEISERDACISILRSQGVLDRVWVRRDGVSNEKTNKYCSKSCKVCEQRDSSKNMLICDNCEDAFHASCYNPRIKILPLSEWLCSSCLKKKHKILNDKSASNNQENTGTETGINRHSTWELELGSLEFMFTDTEPYMSNVRVGNEFQADVPDWCGPVDEDCNYFGDVLEVHTSSNIDTQDKDAINFLKHSPIGNWIQCREVIEGVGEGIDGTVCGKWRRAPLIEVQTDNWECFRCILWDPTRADCAAPQELETEEVMKQLKYVEMLRPRLAAKKCKLEKLKGSCPRDRRGFEERRR
ncbi:protein let-418-like isoform X1 [Salvia splendens]|uniref:protein let-418-like isoform X1 n=1 Tax=Salvia splendens TaxID=180675 RepID=UPI001C263AD4|nr:protein let-418-like isoform X1 [Salvia splendens]